MPIYYPPAAAAAAAGVTTIAVAGSTPNTAGGEISGSTLTLQPANGSNPGIVSTLSQSFGGTKTFTGKIVTDNGLIDSTVADASNAEGISIDVKNFTAVNSRYPLMIRRAGTIFFWLRADGQAEFFQGIRVSSSQIFGPSSSWDIWFGGLRASSSSARCDITQAQTSQDIAIYSARTMTSGNFAVRVGSSVADASVGNDAKLFTVATGITGVNATGTEKLSVMGDGKISYATAEFTDDSANVGNRTVNKITGINKIAASGTTITITNSKVKQNGHVDVVLITADATAIIKNVDTSTAGQFVLNIVACTGDTKFRWRVMD